jgi:hypothetical protein
MCKSRYRLMLSALMCCSLSAWAARLTAEEPGGLAASSGPATKAEPLISPSVGQTFYEIARELANSEDITGPQAEQAITFLTAATAVDEAGDYAQPLLITLACRHGKRDYSQQISGWLVDYLDKSADVEVAKEAVRYLLERLNSREERERLLTEMLANLGGKNDLLDSELTTLLGLLRAERGDVKTAQLCLARAYDKNKYNKLAFAKLVELVPERIGPATYLEHLRLVLRENPMDIQAALDFAQYAERLELYGTAAAAYEYCANLFAYLYPAQSLPPHIYLPWAISSYNTERNQQKCLEIAETIRKAGRFDILLEAIAGKAAEKIGKAEEASRIFQTAELKAEELLKRGPRAAITPSQPADEGTPEQIGAKQFAWFYCFASPDPAKALDWANKAYSTDPNSVTAAGILAYALVMNQQLEWAKPLIESYEHNQIAELALAQIQLAEGGKDSAIETLKSAIAKDTASLAAERAKEILAEQGGEYVSLIDPDLVLTVLKKSIGPELVPQFTTPDKVISAQLNVPGSEFAYGDKFAGTVVVMNNSSEPLVISDDGLFRGNIRVDANISGDLNKKIPNLVSRKVRTALLIDPNQSLLIPLSLVTGDLRRMLLDHPQASLDIEFTLYLDPITTDQGEVSNRLVDIKPARVVLKRPGIELNGKDLRSRFNSISTSQIGQKVKTAELFVGLLKEQQTMAEHGALYRFKYADWMPTLLRSALVLEAGLLLNPADSEWPVKVQTMADMISLPLDHELTSVVAKGLNNANWPVRMMAVYLLAKCPDGEFSKVLDWVAENDSNTLVRDMATELHAASPEMPQPEPEKLPE